MDDLPEDKRSWDLFKTCTKDLANRAEFIILQIKEVKLQAIYSLMHKGAVLLGYEYIAIVDDDMDMDCHVINVLFEICREYRLKLASHSSHTSSVLAQHGSR